METVCCWMSMWKKEGERVAERRMFAKTIIDSDAFLEMPATAQMLYFHLAMRADDDGFINSPKRIMRMIGSGDDDLKLLIVKRFIIPFESGVVVIKHWKIHNFIQSDRYKETAYLEEKSRIRVKENRAYTLIGADVDADCIQNGSNMDPQVRLGKSSIDESRGSQKLYLRERNRTLPEMRQAHPVRAHRGDGEHL